MKKTLCALILGLTSFSAFSFDGNKLYDWGKAWKEHNGEAFKSGVYSGYILGVDSSWRGIAYCAPDETINEQLFDIVFDYLKSHPATRTKDAATLIVQALAVAYPCEKK